MASVFLSYAREDAAKAEALAAALERAGHDVWWDRHIRSGSEFAGAIEEALKRAGAVLVLWSEESVRSSWVRDEAAEGRDSGRLVAAVLDGSRPPIGFRQFQSTDLSGWTGRGTPKQVGELLSAIEEIQPNPHDQETRSPVKARRSASRPFVLVAAVALVVTALVAAGAWLFWTRDSASAAETPTLAVLPFTDLSPQRDKAYFAEGVAEEILSVLARDPGIKVIGRSSSRQFQDSSSDLHGIRKALGVTHVLEGSTRTSGDDLRMSVRLIDASNGRQLWAEDYAKRMSNIFAVQAEIGRAVAKRLSGSLSRGARGAGPQSTAVDTYTLYLAARAKMRERTEPSLKQALQLAKRVIASDQRYAPGHALYTELLWLLSEHNYGTLPIDEVREVGKRHALLSIKLAPQQAEGHAALGVLAEGDEAIAALKKAIELDPSRSELRLWLAGAYDDIGRNSEGLEQHRAAVAMEPIWAPAVRNLANTLAASGRYKEAEAAVREFESRGGAPAQAALNRAGTSWLAGDLSEAVRHSEAAARLQPDVLSSIPVMPLLYHDIGLFERAGALARREPRLRLYASGKYDDLADTVKSEGLWGHAYEWLAIDALARIRDWASLATFYDGRTGSARQDCSDRLGTSAMIHFATAFKARARNQDAARLLDCVKKIVALQSRGPIRSQIYPGMYLAQLSAEIHALEGNGPAAFREMSRAVRLGMSTPHTLGLSFYPAFDQYRSTPEYRDLDALFKRRTSAERQQLNRS
ncbi:MAG: TIR domain-containing protein [Sphingomonas sp.]|nr:TIR domain-containing protein [Sphingomonas sp.]